MNKDQQSGRTQSELDSIIRSGKWGSQSEANSHLQRHGLSCEIKGDGTAQIFDDQNNRKPVATVRFQSGDQQNISSIDY